MRDLMKSLCALPGVSGWEDQVRAAIAEAARPYVSGMRTDPLGNLIVEKKGRTSGKRLVLAAHMDEPGLIVSRITDEGYLRFQLAGELDRRSLLGKVVQVGGQAVPGVIGGKAIHLTTREERKHTPKAKDLYIDIGAANRAQAEEKVRLGDPAVFRCGAEDFGEGLIKGRALGSRGGCAVLLSLLREELPMDVTMVFTVQKEVGAKGALAAGFALEPDAVLVLEGCPAADCAGVPDHRKGCRLGGGPVVKLMDRGALYDRGLFQLVKDNAREIPFQMWQGDEEKGTGGALQRGRAGARALALALPVRHSRTPCQAASWSDLEGMLALTRAFVRGMAEGG